MFIPVLILIVATIAARRWLDDWQTLPYFPIELSRMLATGPWATWVFRITLALIAIVYARADPWRAAACFCALGVSVVRDDVSWLGHMVFVWGLLLVAVARVWVANRAAQYVVLLALVTYAARIVLKVNALARCGEVGWTELRRSFAYSQEIMTGARRIRNDDVRSAFQLGGLLQWLAFLQLAIAM